MSKVYLKNMKHLKLFEQHSNNIEFKLPPLFEIPRGIKKDNIYVVEITTEDSDSAIFLEDYKGIEKIYDMMNYRLIHQALSLYEYMIKRKMFPNDARYKNTHTTRSDDKFLKLRMTRKAKEETISILAEHTKFGPPIDVFMSFHKDPVLSKLKDLVQPSPPKVSKFTGSFEGSGKYAYFDPNRESNASDTVFTEKSKRSIFNTWAGKCDFKDSYYLEFPNIGYCQFFTHYANEWAYDKYGDSLFVKSDSVLDDYFHGGYIDKIIYDLNRDQINNIMECIIDEGASRRLVGIIEKQLSEDKDPASSEFECKKVYYFEYKFFPSVPSYRSEFYKEVRESSRLSKDLIDEIIKKLPKNKNEVEVMLKNLSEVKKNSLAEDFKNHQYSGYIFSSLLNYGSYAIPTSTLKESKSHYVPEHWRNVTPEMIRNADQIDIYLMCYSGDMINLI